MDETEVSIQELKEKNQDLEKALSAQMEIIKQNESDLSGLKRGYYVPKEEYEKLLDAYKIGEKERNELILQHDVLKSTLEIAENKISTLETQISRHGTDIKLKLKELDSKDDHIKDLSEQIRHYEALQTKNKADQLQFVGEKKALSDTVSRYEAHIEELDQTIQDLIKEIGDLTLINDEKDSIIFELDNQLKKEQSMRDTLNSELNAKNGRDQKSKASDMMPSLKITGQMNIAETRRQLIDAKNMIDSLKLELKQTKKEAERSHSLQVALDQRNREYANLQQQNYQKESELRSDRNVVKILNDQIKEYKDTYDEVVSKANTECYNLNKQIKFYKQAAVDIGNQKEEMQKQYDKKCLELRETKEELEDLQNEKYGLAEVISENRGLKSMISQKQAAIADLVFQIRFYENILAKLEREEKLPPNFDYDLFVKEAAEEMAVEEKKAEDTAAVKVMTKAIAKEQNRKTGVNIVIDQETTIVPPREMETERKFADEAFKPIEIVKMQPQESTIFQNTSLTRNDSAFFIDQTKPLSKETTFRVFEESENHTSEEKPFSQESQELSQQTQKIIPDNTVDIYKEELSKVQKQNYELIETIMQYKTQVNELKSKLEKRSSKTETSTSLSPTMDQVTFIPKSEPPLPISAFESGDQMNQTKASSEDRTESNSVDEPEPESKVYAVEEEESSDDDLDSNILPPFLKNTEENIEKSNQLAIFNSTQPQVNIPIKITPSLSMVKAVRLFDVRPPSQKLASDFCKLTGIIGVQKEEAEKTFIAKGIKNDIEEVNLPIPRVMKENKSDLVVLTTKDSFLIHKAQFNNFNESIEKLQKKATTRKHTINELDEKAKQQIIIQEKLQQTNNDLMEELNKQREEFQERLLQMRNETDRYIEMQKAEIVKSTEFNQDKQLEQSKKKSKELQDVSKMINDLKYNKQQLEASLEESRDTSRYMQKRNHELCEQIKSLEKELMAIKEKPSESTKAVDFQRYAKKLKVKLTDLQEKYDQLSEEHEALKRKKFARADVYGVEIHENAVDDLPQDIRPRASVDSVRSSNSSSAAKQSSIEALKVKRLQAQIEESNTKYSELQTQLARQIETNKRLQKLLQSKETTTMQMQSQIATLKQKLLAQKRKYVTK